MAKQMVGRRNGEEAKIDARPNGDKGIENLKRLLSLQVNDTNEIRLTVIRLSKGALRLDVRQWYRNADEEKITHPGKGVMIPVTKEVMRALRDATHEALAIVEAAKAEKPQPVRK